VYQESVWQTKRAQPDNPKRPADKQSSVHILKTGFALFEQLLYIFPHPPGLFPDITYMNHFTAMIDTRRTADKEMTTVAILHGSSPFEFLGQGLTESTHYIASTGIEGRHADPKIHVLAARHTRTGCPVMLVSGIRFGGQIDPQSNLTSIQRGLLHDRDSARRLFLQDNLQSLPLRLAASLRKYGKTRVPFP